MSLTTDAVVERDHAQREAARLVDALADLAEELAAGKPAKAVMAALMKVKQGPWLGLVGSVSRCLSLEAAAEMVAAAEARDRSQQALWSASEDRWRETYVSRTWDAKDGKTRAAGD